MKSRSPFNIENWNLIWLIKSWTVVESLGRFKLNIDDFVALKWFWSKAIKFKVENYGGIKKTVTKLGESGVANENWWN